MGTYTYNPRVFDVPNEEAARQIIVTPEGGLSTDTRWERETPYLGELLSARLKVPAGGVVIDYGCGIGRVAKELIGRLGCHVIGVDISQDMRSLALGYVRSPNFSAVSPEVLRAMVRNGLRVDAAISIWVIQHCLRPQEDLDLIKSAMKEGARLGVVNNRWRAVPTVGGKWADDGLDARQLLEQTFRPLETAPFDPAVVSQLIADRCFWAIYGR